MVYLLFRFLFILKPLLISFCVLISKKNLPVAFTFFVPFSLPAIALFLKGRNAASVYLHSMSSGFACPLSFYLLLRKASVVKTADDWYLTGGCHYSFDVINGKVDVPLVLNNSFGRFIVRLNWYFKRKVLGIFSHCTFISPSHWLSSRYKNLYSDRCLVVYNSASSPVVNLLSPPRVSTSSSRKHIGNFSSSAKSVSLGLPVTYLRDSRKGFLDILLLLLNV